MPHPLGTGVILKKGVGLPEQQWLLCTAGHTPLARKPHLHSEALLAGWAEPPEARRKALQRGHLVAIHACAKHAHTSALIINLPVWWTFNETCQHVRLATAFP